MGLFLIGGLWLVLKKLRIPSTINPMPWAYLAYLVLCGLALYMAGYRIGVVDIRFLPFFQFFFIVGGALLFPSSGWTKGGNRSGLSCPCLHLPVGGQPGNLHRRLDQIQLCRF